MNRIKDYLSEELNRYKFFSLLIFIGIITLLAWQSDDAYHAYIMAKNLVDGNGFVYNIGQRATASSCPLFTLVIAFSYLIIRNMFFVSLLVNIVFSALAYRILVWNFCKTKNQVILCFITLTGSLSFVSYTTSGLENSMLFFLVGCFLKIYFEKERQNGKRMLALAVLVALIAMTRMDAVLMVAPMAVYVFLCKRDNVKFSKAVGIGVLGLFPFVLWEVFATFYYGFPFPNTAYAKLGTNIALIEYIKRGVKYYINAIICDPVVILVPLMVILCVLTVRKAQYIYCMAGVALYCVYLLYIGGDFMMGRHFTVMFYISLLCYMDIKNREFSTFGKGASFNRTFVGLIFAALIFTYTSHDITKQFLYGENFSSPISDERAGYFKYSSLFNNVISLVKTGDLCIQDAWNDEGIREYRDAGYKGGILQNVPGISKYYNNDMYLNDYYALGDPFLAHLPAVKEANWRIGHMWRQAPNGYGDQVLYGNDGDRNRIENPDASQYYEIIKEVTCGDLFSSRRISMIINLNLGKYNYLIDNYQSTLDENNMQK